MVRDMDLVRPDVHDTLEVVVDGLSLFGGVQLAVDTTVVSDGEARRNAARRDGRALEAARRRKERTYPELTARGGRALVLLGVEVSGRWSSETRSFLSKLAHDRTRSERSDEETRGTNMAPSLGLPLVLRRRMCSRHVFAGRPRFQRV